MIKNLFALTCAGWLLALSSQAQQFNPRDVIYLKNGDIYTGIIVGITPKICYKIEILGGSIIAVPVDSVRRIGAKISRDYVYEYYLDSAGNRAGRHIPRSVFYHCVNKGAYFEGSAIGGTAFGAKFVSGYKFGQFGYLGLGAGLCYINPWLQDNQNTELVTWGGYVPVFISYSGTLLKRRISPFYNLCGGYAFATSKGASDQSLSNYILNSASTSGGIMGSVALGAVVYTRICYLKVAAEAMLITPKLFASFSYYDNSGNTYNTYTNTTVLLASASLTFTIGFEK